MVQFIESELVLLKKEIDEMWTLVYNQLGRAGEAVLTLDRELAQQVLVRERRVQLLSTCVLCLPCSKSIRTWSVWAISPKA